MLRIKQPLYAIRFRGYAFIFGSSTEATQRQRSGNAAATQRQRVGNALVKAVAAVASVGAVRAAVATIVFGATHACSIRKREQFIQSQKQFFCVNLLSATIYPDPCFLCPIGYSHLIYLHLSAHTSSVTKFHINT